jgi:hypothetical protein
LSQGDRVSDFATDFFADWILGGASAPDIDLSVFPIVPPVEPACPKASDPPAKNMMMARRGLVATPLIWVLNFNRFLPRMGNCLYRR